MNDFNQLNMFRAIMHRRRCRPAASSVHYRPKHVELIEIINKLLLLHLVGCLYYCINYAWSYKHQIQNTPITFHTILALKIIDKK